MYTINVSKLGYNEQEDGPDYNNLTSDLAYNEETYELLDEYKDYMDEGLKDGLWQDEDKEDDYSKDFIGSSYFDSYINSKEVMMSYAHILDREPTEAQIRLLNEIAPNVSILDIHKLDCFAIALNGGGVDLGYEVEMAYLLIDGRSPFTADNYLGNKLLNFMRGSGYSTVKEIRMLLDE